MKFSALIFSITYWLLTNINFAQVTQQWVAYYNGPGNTNDTPGSIAVDDSGNVYVTGESGGSSASCITTVKYNSSGIQQWAARYFDNGNGTADGHSVKLDKFGNVYVTGTACVNSNQNEDVVTIKYNSAGVQRWAALYHVQGVNCRGSDLVLDNAGNIYVTGSANITPENSDFVTIKYNPLGVQQWASVYNGPSSNIDFASKILIDKWGNLYVKGISWVTPMFFEFAIVKYNNSGAQQWAVRQFGSDNTSLYGSGLALDSSGNVYLAACSGSACMQSYLTAKYNSAGIVCWISIYNVNGIPSQCEASSVAYDNLGNIYVTGYSNTPANLSLQGCTTIKYDTSGAEKWVRVYNGNNNTASGGKIMLDRDGGIYVIGSVDNGSSAGYDYLTIKYDSSGAQQWLKMFNGPNGNTDMPRSGAVDVYKNVYVTGWCGGSSASSDFATVKYSQPIGIHPSSTEIPVKFSLYQNYPNPFNPTSKIKFQIPKMSNVRLTVFDVLGREIAVLVEEQLKPGTYEIQWDASNYPSSVYFYKLTAGDYSSGSGRGFSETRKMILLK